MLYVVLMNEGQKSRQPGSLLIAALGMGQMVTVVQLLSLRSLLFWEACFDVFVVPVLSVLRA